MVIAKRLLALIVGAAALALGGVLLVIAGILVSDFGNDDWTKPDRPAEIVQTRSGGGPIGARTHPRVTYEAEGRRYSSLLRGMTADRTLDVGDTLPVVYRADDPSRPYTTHSAERGPPSIASDIGAIAAVLVFAFVALIFGWLLLTVAWGRRTPVLEP